LQPVAREVHCVEAQFTKESAMHVFLRSASLLLAASIAVGCSDNDHDHDNFPSTPGFVPEDLLSDESGVAPNVDPALVNAWGLAADSQSFWIANNGTGKILVIAPDGTPSKFSPPAAALDVGPGITGIVANPSAGFLIGPVDNAAPATMLVASETGQIFAINADVAAMPQLVIDRSGAGAIYKGLAIYTASDGSTRLAAADFHNARIDVFDDTFHLIANVVIVDPQLRAGLAPFNLYVAGSTLYVSYAVQDANAEDDVRGVGNGRIDAFDLDGHFVRTLVDGGNLNAPWGMQIAPAGFSDGLDGMLIVGNFGDGTMMAIDPNTGVNAQLLTPASTPIVTDGLWGLLFGNGQVGQSSSLYFAAGPADETHGLYGRVTFGTPPPI
jgi:uncharacterized protein (TIGR03118 family)